jgi:hypothetical protein
MQAIAGGFKRFVFFFVYHMRVLLGMCDDYDHRPIYLAHVEATNLITTACILDLPRWY